MFNYISGSLAHTGRDFVVVDNHGIGWQISVPSTVINRLQGAAGEVKLFTYLAVREDDMQLYGFVDSDELALFKLLLSVSGIGPKAALGVLSTLSATEFHLAVIHENVKALTRVPGVGPKSAKRLIIELKEKVSALGLPNTKTAAFTPSGDSDALQDTLEALLSLGYSGTEVQAVLLSITDRETMTAQDLLRTALTKLGAK